MSNIIVCFVALTLTFIGCESGLIVRNNIVITRTLSEVFVPTSFTEGKCAEIKFRLNSFKFLRSLFVVFLRENGY